MADGRNLTLNGVFSGGVGMSVSSTGGAAVSFGGNNTYTGAMQLTGGLTRFNGQFVSLSATAQVGNGATLGGAGSFAGAVTVNGGGTITPGNSVGTITVGDLVLNAGSVLDFELGTPAASDRITISRNLTVNGATTINASDAGGFGAGTYTLITYGGTASGLNNLALGTTPAGLTSTLNTGVAGQVQLVAGSNVQFWDGGDTTPGNIANGRGGAGTWDGSATNWTNAAGSANSAWPAGIGVFAGTAGTVTVSGAQSFETLQFSTTGYTLSGDALTATGAGIIRVDPGVTARINSAIGGVGLVKNDSGTLVLGGANTLPGITVNAGTLRLAHAGAAGSGAVTLNGGTLGIAGVAGFFALSSNIVLGAAGGTLTNNVPGASAAVFNLSGSITGAGALNIAHGDNPQEPTILTGAATHGGGTTINLGSGLQIGANGTAGSLAGGVVNHGALVFNRSDAVSFAGNISGSGFVQVMGGAVTLAGDNSYTGRTVVSSALRISAAGNIGTGEIVLGGGSLSTGANMTLANAVSLASGASIRPDAGTMLRLDGIVTSNPGALLMPGAGTLVLANASNTIAAGMTVSGGGAVRLLNAGAAGGGTITLDGGTLGSRSDGVAGALMLSNPIVLGAGGGTLAPGNAGGATANPMTLAGGITGAGALVVAGFDDPLGVVLTSAASQTGGTTITGRLTIGAGGSLAGNAVNNGQLAFQDAGTLTQTGVISGTGRLTVAGNTALTLTGVNPGMTSGGVGIAGAGASLHVAADAALGGAGPGIEFFDGGQLSATASFSTARALFMQSGAGVLAAAGGATWTVTGAVQGSGGLGIAGPGTVVLAGVNTHTGALSVNSGTLRVNGSTTASSAVSVASGATLGGAGTIGGMVAVNGGSISPGNSVGNLTVASLVLNAGSTLDFELAAPGTGDRITVTNNLVVNGTTRINAINAGGFGAGTYTLITYGGTATGLSNLVVGSTPSGFSGALNTGVAGQVQLVTGVVQFWDGANTTAGNVANGRGGTSTWDASGTSWTTNTGSTNAAWASAAATFAGTAGLVTVNGAQSFESLQFSSAGYTLTGDALTITGSGIIRVDPGITATVNNRINGNLVKNDSGTLALGGPTNSIGNLTVNGGTLRLSGSSLDITGTLTTGSTTLEAPLGLTTAIPVVLAGAARFSTGSAAGASISLGGAITGAGPLIAAGAGTLNILGQATHGGGTQVNAGATLQISNTVFNSDIVNQGRVIFASGTAPSYTGVMSGSGSLTVENNTQLNLMGANSFTGGSTIRAGSVLAVGRGGLADNSQARLTGPVVNHGDLWFLRRGFNTIFAGDISGTGGLATSGSLTLTGNNSYTGGTVISSGSTLTIGGSGNIGTGVIELRGGLAVTGNTQLANNIAILREGNANPIDFSRLTAVAGTTLRLDGVIIGEGRLSILGEGVVVLTGANTHGGGTIIGGGTLSIANDAALGAAQAPLTIGVGSFVRELNLEAPPASGTPLLATTVSFTTARPVTLQSQGGDFAPAAGTTLTLAGTLSGSGNLNLAGPGTLNLTGTNSFTGATSVTDGLLAVNSPLTSSSGITVSGAGRLGGTGTLPSVTIGAGGTLAPGNSVGTINIAGNLTLNAGATTVIEVQGMTADRINVTGTASLGGTLQLVAAGGGYSFNTPYTLIQAGRMTGSFATVSTQGSFGVGVVSSVTSSATQVELTLAPANLSAVSPASAPLFHNYNQRATAGALDAAARAGGNLSPFFNVYNQSASNIARALSQLSGEVATAGTAMGIAAGDQFLATLLDPFGYGRESIMGGRLRLGSAGGEGAKRYAVWGTATGAYNRTTGDANDGSATRSTRTAGFVLGFDHLVGAQSLVGGAIAVGESNASLSAGLGTSRGNYGQLGLHGSTRLGSVTLAAAAAATFMDIETNRTLYVLGQDRQRGDGSATTWSARVEARQEGVERFGVRLQPFAALQWQQVDGASYTERSNLTGATLGQNVTGGSNTSLRTELGAQLDGQIAVGTYRVRGFARLAWAHYMIRDQAMGLGFAGLPNAGYTLRGAQNDPNSALIALGAETEIRPGLAFGVRLDSELSGNVRQVAGTARLRYSF